MVGLICAMEVEAERLKGAMCNTRREVISGIAYHSGTLFGKEVVVAVSGVGKVFAAVCAQTMILRFQPDAIINTGVAGSLSGTLRIGDIVIADRVLQHDLDTTALGDPPGGISGINLVYLPCDTHLAQSLQQSVAKIDGLHAEVGTIASGDQFINDAAKKAAITQHFGAIACEMEGAAIGHVCYINDVPCSVLRAISDSADDSSHMDFPAFVQLASHNSFLVLEEFFPLLRNRDTAN